MIWTFKVAGTSKGITAIQMDIKIKGIDAQILKAALQQARKGRLFIMDKMFISNIRASQGTFSICTKNFTINIDPDKIRDVIGPGGKLLTRLLLKQIRKLI